MKNLIVSIAGILFLFLATNCSDFIGNTEPVGSQDELVLKSKKKAVWVAGEFNVWVNEPPAPVDGILYQTEYGISNAPHPNHLGITELYNEEVIYLSANTGLVPWDQVDPWIAMAMVTLTSANGDELFIEINYALNPEAFPYLTAEGLGNVTGGTGRFIEATGTFNFSATFNVTELKGTQQYSGEITY